MKKKSYQPSLQFMVMNIYYPTLMSNLFLLSMIEHYCLYQESAHSKILIFLPPLHFALIKHLYSALPFRCSCTK